jgi:hypothetical protein
LLKTYQSLRLALGSAGCPFLAVKHVRNATRHANRASPRQYSAAENPVACATSSTDESHLARRGCRGCSTKYSLEINDDLFGLSLETFGGSFCPVSRQSLTTRLIDFPAGHGGFRFG